MLSKAYHLLESLPIARILACNRSLGGTWAIKVYQRHVVVIFIEEVDVGHECEVQMRLEIFFYSSIQLALSFHSRNCWKWASHRNKECFELSHNILSKASCAKTDSHAEMTDPWSWVFAYFKIIIITCLEAHITEFSVTFIVWLLWQVQVSLEIYTGWILQVQLQDLRSKHIDCLIKENMFCWAFLISGIVHYIFLYQISHRRYVLNIN